MGSYGLFFSQRVLLALVETGLERQKAYEMVQAVAMRCWQERSFPKRPCAPTRPSPAIWMPPAWIRPLI